MSQALALVEDHPLLTEERARAQLAPYRTFAAWNITGGTLWAGGFVLLGYAAGSQYQRVARNVTIFGLALLAPSS